MYLRGLRAEPADGIAVARRLHDAEKETRRDDQNHCGNVDVTHVLAQPIIGVFGEVFPQKGLVAKTGVIGISAQAKIDLAPSMSPGTNIPTRSYPDGSLYNKQVYIPCDTLSPVSNSNLVFFSETDGGANNLSITLVSANIIYV